MKKPPLVPIPVPKKRARKKKPKTPKSAGAPSKCTPEIIEQVLTLAVSLVTDRDIYRSVGISHQTWNRWKHDATTGRQPYARLFAEMEQQRGMKTVQLVNGIGNDPDWRAKAWLLERLDPQTYSLRHRIEHSGPNGLPLAPAGPAATPIQIIIQGGAPEDNPYLAPEPT